MTLEAGLLQRAKGGDREAFTSLVRQHDPMLRALAYRMLADRHAMDDALQDAYLRAFRSIGKFRGGSAISTWLYRIVYTSCIDHLRRRRPLEELTDAPSLDNEVDQSIDLARALEKLKPEHRAVVMLIDAQGFTYDEVARITGVPAGTVKSRLSRAHRILRESLGGGSK